MAARLWFDGDGGPVVLRIGGLATRAEAAAHSVADGLRGLGSIRCSPPVRTGQGVLFRVSGVSADFADDVVATLETQLVRNGLSPADVRLEPLGGLDALDAAPRAVVLRAFPSGVTIPGQWLGPAIGWVTAGNAVGAVQVRLLGATMTRRDAEALEILGIALEAGAWCDMAYGDPERRVRTASMTFGSTPHLALAAGGPGCDDECLAVRGDVLRDVARTLAPEAGYTCINIEETFADVGNGLPGDGWYGEGGADPNVVAARLGTTHLPDVFWYQILTTGHAQRLRAGTDADEPSIGRPLGDDRFEVTIGEIEDWLPGARRGRALRSDAWITLEPLLLLADDLERQLAADAMSPASIRLTAFPHASRGPELSVLELVALLAGEPHGDSPATVAPPLATFARQFAAALDDDERQSLHDVAIRLAATPSGAPGAKRSAIAGWLIAQAARWLAAAEIDVAGLTDEFSLADPRLVAGTVERLVEVTKALADRFQVATSLAGTAAAEIEQLSWEAWERVAERTGTEPAVAALVTGVPSAISDGAAEQVIAALRDKRHGDRPTPASESADELWHATAAEAGALLWDRWWTTLESHVAHHWSFSVRTAVRRALESDGAGRDRNAIDQLLEDADAHARDALARLVLQPRAGSSAWTAARDAIAGDPSSRPWIDAVAEARRSVTEELFDEAAESARTGLDEGLATAASDVRAAVVAAVGREAIGSAVRSLAAQAAAPVLRRGDGIVSAGVAADAEVDADAAEQTAAAFRLLDALTTTRPLR